MCPCLSAVFYKGNWDSKVDFCSWLWNSSFLNGNKMITFPLKVIVSKKGSVFEMIWTLTDCTVTQFDARHHRFKVRRRYENECHFFHPFLCFVLHFVPWNLLQTCCTTIQTDCRHQATWQMLSVPLLISQFNKKVTSLLCVCALCRLTHLIFIESLANWIWVSSVPNCHCQLVHCQKTQ